MMEATEDIMKAERGQPWVLDLPGGAEFTWVWLEAVGFGRRAIRSPIGSTGPSILIIGAECWTAVRWTVTINPWCA